MTDRVFAAQADWSLQELATFFTVEEDAPLPEIAERMVRAQIHRLPVGHAGTKRDVAGIISAIDVLKWVRSQDVA